MLRQIEQHGKDDKQRSLGGRGSENYRGGAGQFGGTFVQPGCGQGISFVLVGNVNCRTLATPSVFPVVAEKHNVVANNKKDMQNTFFM
jgi:hypothetical protein